MVSTSNDTETKSDFQKVIFMIRENQTPDVEIQVKKQQEKKLEKRNIYQIQPNNGHIVFEVDIINNCINIAKYEIIHTVHIHYWREQLRNKEIIKKEGCIYVSALNLSNLAKRVKRYYDIDISKFCYNPDLNNSGFALSVDVNECYFKK